MPPPPCDRSEREGTEREGDESKEMRERERDKVGEEEEEEGRNAGDWQRTCSRYTGLCEMPRDSRVSRSRFSLVDPPIARSGVYRCVSRVKSA